MTISDSVTDNSQLLHTLLAEHAIALEDHSFLWTTPPPLPPGFTSPLVALRACSSAWRLATRWATPPNPNPRWPVRHLPRVWLSVSVCYGTSPDRIRGERPWQDHHLPGSYASPAPNCASGLGHSLTLRVQHSRYLISRLFMRPSYASARIY